MSRLEVIDLHKDYEGKPLLNGVSFFVDSGETLCLLGSSGSGKSTILRIIAGIETPDSGQVLWQGKDVSGIPVYKRNFGLMFQDYALFPHLTVAENVAFGLRMQRFPREKIAQKIAQALERVNMTAFAARRVTDLSGGEQQRIALARALAASPQLLMLDEPLAALDRGLRVELQEELRALLHETGIPAIYVTHDQEEAISLGDRLALLHGGRIVQCGPTEAVYRYPANRWVAEFLGMTGLLTGKVITTSPLTVSTDCGDLHPLHAPGVAEPVTGSQVTVLIKPLGLTQSTGDTGVDVLNGIVEDVRFLGDHYRVNIRLCTGTIFSVPSVAAYPIDEPIHLQLQPGDLLLLPD